MKAVRYRLRWANVSVYGYCCVRQRMCIAERYVPVLWFGIWWPVNDWRRSEASAQRDIDHDKLLRSPIPTPRPIA